MQRLQLLGCDVAKWELLAQAWLVLMIDSHCMTSIAVINLPSC